MVLIVVAGIFFSGCSYQSANSADPFSYNRFLSISAVQSYYYKEPGAKESYPLVKGALSNVGSESLGVVEFTLHYKDNLNRQIYEEHAYPVCVYDRCFKAWTKSEVCVSLLQMSAYLGAWTNRHRNYQDSLPGSFMK